jgi:hypothetical protein
MRFGTWNVRSLYTTGSLRTVARELVEYKSDVGSVQEVIWETGGGVKGSFCEELGRVCVQFPRCVMKLFGDFSEKVGREDIFKPTAGNTISNITGVRVVNFATYGNLVVKNTTFPLHYIHKYTLTSPEGKTHNQFYR